MKIEKYRKIRIAVAVVIAMLFSQGLILNNIFLAIVVAISGALILMYFKSQVKEVMADERDYQIGGKAAMLSIQIYSWVAAIIMLALYLNRELNPGYEIAAYTLAYSTCFLMLAYSVVFKLFGKIVFSKKKALYYFGIAALVAITTVLSLRFFSGEDNWECKDGQWIKHGQPAFEAPMMECK